jgi:hypothetical protein
MPRHLLPLASLMALPLFAAEPAAPATQPVITFNTNFEGGSIGRIEAVSPTAFRLHVAGQQDEKGHNRQATWYYVRLDHVKARELSVTLTDFMGEYDGKPACPMSAALLPVVSDDGKRWQHVAGGDYDDANKELTLHLKPDGDSLWLAHIPPYVPSDLQRLLGDLSNNPTARVEVIGRTARRREIPMVTVTDFATPDDGKKVVWLQARQHAWEAGTSYVVEGALRFITSDDPAAVKLRATTVFYFTPMVDLDGCAAGGVRFNANGYDVNRHWPEVNLRGPLLLRVMPEIWYTKKAIVTKHREKPIDLLLNLHNTETTEYVESEASDEKGRKTLGKLFDLLSEKTTFDPSRPLSIREQFGGTTNSLYGEYGIPAALMEQRISTGKKLGHKPTVEDRLEFGKQLIGVMAEAVQ